MDHRRVQRALFRMQLDPGFASRLRARDAKALRSAGLAPAESALLARADPLAVSADRDGKRRAQVLRNVTSEFALSLASAGDSALVESFPASAEFHEAVAQDASLPLAFAGFLAARVQGATPLVRALAALEATLARARRSRRAAPPLAPGELALAPWVELVRLPAGTLEAAARVRTALDREEPAPLGVDVSNSEHETLLLRRAPEPSPFQLAKVEVESLSPELASLLARAETGLDGAALRAHAAAAGLGEAELAEVTAELVAERILVAG